MAILNPNSDTYKSPFIIYKRNDKLHSSDLPVFSDSSDMRNCFIFDADNRSILACTVTDSNACVFEQLVGHTLYKDNNNTDSSNSNITLHGERFNDYENNMPLGIYSFTTGHGTVAYNGFETAVGLYNESVKNSGQLFSVGNGTGNENRSNVLSVYKDNVTVNTDLSVYGNINNEGLNTVINSVNNIKNYVNDSDKKIKELEDEIAELKTTLSDYETVINKLIDNLNTISDTFSDKILLYDIPQDIQNKMLLNKLNDNNIYVTNSTGTSLVQYMSQKTGETKLITMN